MNDPLDWIDDVAAERANRGLTRRLVAHRTGLIHFGSNDYLGLAADPRLAEAAHRAAETYGWGAGASPLVSGWTDAHQSLVDTLADFEQSEAVALFPTGFSANLGTVAALVGAGDAVYLDRLNHACLIDGAHLSGARLRVYPHVDTDRLGQLLDRDRGRFRRSLIATDGVFSMDGDLAPLGAIADLAAKAGAMLLVDEAHGTGVFGADGRGAASAFGVANRVHARVGTLSKALGSVGGFVAGSARLVDHIVNHARTLIYSTALPAPVVAASFEALRIARAEPWRRVRVLALADDLRGRLTRLGFDYGPSAGPIVPLFLGEPARAVGLSQRLLSAGLFAPAIRPPTVPQGTSRLRISLTANHSADDLDTLVRALEV